MSEHCNHCEGHEHKHEHEHEHEHKHGHDHGHEHGQEENPKKEIIRIAVGAAIFGLSFLAVEGSWQRLTLLAVSYIILGGNVAWNAVTGLFHGEVFDENFLMAVATLGAIALALYQRSGDFNEAVAVMLFYQIGELFQSYAIGKSRRNISALMDIRPDYANIEQDGELVKTDPDEVSVGTVIVVQPGLRPSPNENSVFRTGLYFTIPPVTSTPFLPVTSGCFIAISWPGCTVTIVLLLQKSIFSSSLTSKGLSGSLSNSIYASCPSTGGTPVATTMG